jgi:hypothetical protein
MPRHHPTTTGSTSIVCGIIAALAWGPKTQTELFEIVESPKDTISQNLLRLHFHGLVYREGSRHPEWRENKGGSREVLWALCLPPFSKTDAVSVYGRPLSSPARKKTTALAPVVPERAQGDEVLGG